MSKPLPTAEQVYEAVRDALNTILPFDVMDPESPVLANDACQGDDITMEQVRAIQVSGLIMQVLMAREDSQGLADLLTAILSVKLVYTGDPELAEDLRQHVLETGSPAIQFSMTDEETDFKVAQN